MSMKNAIFNSLVVEGKQKSPGQLAAQFGTSRNSIAARISEIRDDGYAIYTNRHVDSKGRVTSYYRHGRPSRAMVVAARQMFKMLNTAA